MILLLRGGFNEAKALDAVSDAFGPAVMGAQKEPVELPEPILADRVYRVQGESPDIRVRIGFNGPRPRNRDSQVLELLAGTLGGDGGILERALASAGFQPRSVLAYLSVNEGFSRFIITSQFPAGTDPSAVRSVMLESVKAFIDSKSFEEEMNRTRRSMVSAEIMGREKLHYFLMGKAQWIISGSPGQGLSPGRWDSITADDLRAAVLKYVTGKPSVSLFTVPEMNGQALERTTTPVKAEAMLDNGLQVVAEQRPGSEVFALHLMTRSRSAVEPENREGIADFLHRLLSRGTASRTREELSDELRSLGASLSTAGDPTVPFGDFYTSRLYSYIRLECVMEAAYEAVPILADMVQNPLLAENEVEDVRKQILDFITYRDASPGSLALRVLGGILYGEGLGSDVYGTRDSIGSITVQDLADFHKRYLTGKNMIISVVSGMKPEESIALVKKAFNDLQTGESPAEPAIHLTFEPELVEMTLGKAQGAIAAGAVTGVIGKRNSPALAVASALLNTRLVEQLREKEGLAYSVGGSLGVVGDRVVFTVSMGTSPDKIERARESIKGQINAAMEAEITTEDMEREINRLVGRLQMRMLSSINRAYYLGLAVRNGAAHTYGEDYRRLLLDLTPEEIEQVTRKYLTGDTLVEVVVH
jgi:zinc protease